MHASMHACIHVGIYHHKGQRVLLKLKSTGLHDILLKRSLMLTEVRVNQHLFPLSLRLLELLNGAKERVSPGRLVSAPSYVLVCICTAVPETPSTESAWAITLATRKSKAIVKIQKYLRASRLGSHL